jgi:ABC-type antimicrobial peptide transport system permease subunit
MRRSIIAWIAITLALAAIGLLLSSLLGRGFDVHRNALGVSLSILGITLMFLTRSPKPSQINPAVIVSMVLSILLFRPVVIWAQWPNRWQLAVYVACWGTLLLLSLTSVAAALFGDSASALILAPIAGCLTQFGWLIMTMARFPTDSRQ